MSFPQPEKSSWHRARFAALAAGVSLCLLGAPAVEAQNFTATLDRSAEAQHAGVALPSLSPLVKAVLPAVVNISVRMKDTNLVQQDDQDQAAPGGQSFPDMPNSPFNDFLRKFFEQQGPGFHFSPPQHRAEMALGSGFIIDPSGYVVTNNHVVQNADKVTVILQDGSKHPAKVVGRDSKTDLALLKISAPKPLPAVSWGDSDAAHVGDWVVAVGNPFGLGGTVSAGILSARGRDIHSGPYDDFLQIDASINRGNSGGPTFDLDGKVIGINTAIYSPNGGSVGIGFAIPSSLAKPVIEQLKEHGKVERGWLGVQIQEVTPELAKSLGLPKAEGALVADVTPDAPAAKVGIKQGDVILSYDGHDITKLRDLPLAVAETPVGQKETVKIWRDGHESTVEPTIAAMPNNPERVAQNEESGPQKTMGLRLESLTSARREELHVPKDVKGVVVASVAPDSPLAQIGVQQGDVIQAINRVPVTSPSEAREQFAKLSQEKGPSRSLLLLLNRHGINQYVAMSVEQGGGNG